ncbi:NACHT%2C LRR and PYD domains-containing protein 12-like, partial [Scomber scombrus]
MKKEEEEEDGAESVISSCVSMKSDWSNDLPPEFSNEPGPSDTNVTGLPLRLQKMRIVEEEEDGAESVISSCLSMKSDRSKDRDPPTFSNEPGPSDTKERAVSVEEQSASPGDSSCPQCAERSRTRPGLQTDSQTSTVQSKTEDLMRKRDLLNILDDLTDNEFKAFKWSLMYVKLGDIEPIKKNQLEKAERRDVVDLMVQKYELAGAVEVMKSVLKKINRNDLVKKLSNISSGSE